MQTHNIVSKLLAAIIALLILSGCTKKEKEVVEDPLNNLSYTAGKRHFVCPYFESSSLWRTFRVLDAYQVSGGFGIEANYTEKTFNTIKVFFYNTVDDLPNLDNATVKGDLSISLTDYGGPNGASYIKDTTDTKGYIRFSHASTEYVVGTFLFGMVRVHPIIKEILLPLKKIQLSNGKFRIQVR